MAISSQFPVVKPRTLNLIPSGTTIGTGANSLTGGVDASALAWIARGLDNYAAAVATLTVTAAATDVGDTLDVFLDTSFDGGTSWVNVGHFAQVLGNGGAKKHQCLIPAPIAAAVADRSSDLAAGAAAVGIGSQLRARAVTVDADNDAAWTFGVQVKLLPA